MWTEEHTEEVGKEIDSAKFSANFLNASARGARVPSVNFTYATQPFHLNCLLDVDDSQKSVFLPKKNTDYLQGIIFRINPPRLTSPFP